MTKKITKQTAKAEVSVKHKDGSVEESEVEVGEERMFIDPPCNVGLSLGFTQPDKQNQYANTKVSVSLFVPCKHEEIEETFEFVQGWVDDKVAEIYNSL